MRTALLLSTAAMAALCLLAFTHQPWSDAPTSATDPVDAVLGKGGFNIFCPVVPGNGIPHETQVTRRLTLLEMLLRQRDVSAWPTELRAERKRNLDRLHDYRIRAEYPRNYDHPDQLLPCFIDRDGRICAVGYLVEQSVGRSVSEKINASHQYQTIAQIHEPVLDGWIARSGLTLAEVETIQEPESWPGEMIQIAASTNPVATTSQQSPVTKPVTPAAVRTRQAAVTKQTTRMLQAQVQPQQVQPQQAKPQTAPARTEATIK